MLPVELVEHILEHLRDHRPSLASSALVHSSWTSPSQRFLFELVILTTRAHCLALLTPLRKSPHLRHYIRTLFINGAAWTILILQVTELKKYGHSIADIFPCVHHLRVADVTNEFFIDQLTYFCHSIRQLTLARCSVLPRRRRLEFRLSALRMVRCTYMDRFLDTMVDGLWPMLGTLVLASIEHNSFGVEVHAAVCSAPAHAVLRAHSPFVQRLRSPMVTVEWCDATREPCCGLHARHMLTVSARSERTEHWPRSDA
jgi:hypothetical protein